MNFGLLFAFRNPPHLGRTFSQVYDEELSLIEFAEELGYDTVWLSEHHFAQDGYSPALLPLAAAISQRTSQIRIGTNLVILPLHNAVRLAEDVAVVDILSNGRLDLGLGLGYARHEFTGFGIPRSERRDRFLEGLAVMQGLWGGDEFSFEGSHYQIDRATLTPLPLQRPGPPLWVGAGTSATVARAANLGVNLLSMDPKLVSEFDAIVAAGGREPASVAAVHWVHVAGSADEAWSHAAEPFHAVLSAYSEWADSPGDVPMSVPPADALRGASRLLVSPIFGSPDEVAIALASRLRRSRTTHLCLGMRLPGLSASDTRTSMELFAREVIPRLEELL